MEPIETEYKGYRFRSRLEARWAVFLDALNVQYQYEPEGFRFEDGTRYLPDFWIEKSELWLEVKGSAPTADEKSKAEKLHEIGTPVVVGVSEPHFGRLMVYAYDAKESSGGCQWWDSAEELEGVALLPAPGLGMGIAPYFQSRTFPAPGIQCLTPREYEDGEYTGVEAVKKAALDARSAQFEHGEKGAGRV